VIQRLMTLASQTPITSCLIKIQYGFTFQALEYPGCPKKMNGCFKQSSPAITKISQNISRMAAKDDFPQTNKLSYASSWQTSIAQTSQQLVV